MSDDIPVLFVKKQMLTDLFSERIQFLNMSQNHRITETSEFESTFKGCPVQLACNEQGHQQLH